CSLLWIVRVVVKVRNESGVELDVAARAVHLLEIIESLLNDAVSFDNVAGLQSDVALYIIGGEFGVVLDFDFGRSILPAFVDGYHEFQPLTFVTKDRDPGAYLSDLFDSRFSEVSLEVTVIRIGQHAKPVEIRLKLLLVINVLRAEGGEDPELFDVLHMLAKVAAGEDLIALELDIGDSISGAFLDFERQ